MEERPGIRQRIEEAKRRAKGDGLGLLVDWELQASAVNGALAHYRAHPTDENRDIYLNALREMLPVVGGGEMALFRQRNFHAVRELVPHDVNLLAALSELPNLQRSRSSFERLIKLAEALSQNAYRTRIEALAASLSEKAPRWVEPPLSKGEEGVAREAFEPSEARP